MPRPATTDAQRIKRTDVRMNELHNAINARDWARVAALAGNVQRDARLLAGLGRGG